MYFWSFFYVAGHGNVNIFICHVIRVVPFEGDSTVEESVPIFQDCVVFIECMNEVVCVFSADVFHAKVIDNKSETNGA